ncbi:MAG: hypothetical protein K6U12_07030 [Armatimonadetes bacterium]|nr:hypothetical protein [Armatimonadota bacterium]CUU37291.1 PIN domain [Armatimonadetes bacterium DC]
MKVYILDSSAWIKRYKQEEGSEKVDTLFKKAGNGSLELFLLPIVYYEVFARIRGSEPL